MALNAEQVEVKNRTIGGSDVAALFGESPWAQPMDVWMRVTGRKPLEAANDDLDPNDPKNLGSELENFLRERYERRLRDEIDGEIRVHQRHKPKFHVELPYLAGNIDADVVGQRRLGEMKLCLFADRAQWGEEGTDQVPAYYLLQVHFYLNLFDYETADLFAWFGRTDFRRYEFHRDTRLDDIILERCRTFWQDHVEADEPPQIDYGHPGAERIVRDLYPGTNGQRIMLPEVARSIHDTLKDVSTRMKDMEATQRELRTRLREMVGENAVGYLPGGGGYSRKTVKRDGYVVEPTEYETFTYSGNLKPKEGET